jgi:uncharacterized protein YuzE
MNGPIDIYYDDEGDFLEITIANPPKESYCEDIDEDVFIRKDEATGEVIGIGILNFKEHAKDLKNILVNVPVKINFEILKTPKNNP